MIDIIEHLDGSWELHYKNNLLVKNNSKEVFRKALYFIEVKELEDAVSDMCRMNNNKMHFGEMGRFIFSTRV